MSLFIVDGYRRIKVSMWVEAESPEDAIQMAKDGRYLQADTEPDVDLHRPAWTARRQRPARPKT